MSLGKLNFCNLVSQPVKSKCNLNKSYNPSIDRLGELDRSIHAYSVRSKGHLDTSTLKVIAQIDAHESINSQKTPKVIKTNSILQSNNKSLHILEEKHPNECDIDSKDFEEDGSGMQFSSKKASQQQSVSESQQSSVTSSNLSESRLKESI